MASNAAIEEEIFEELGTRLYEWSDSRSLSLPTSAFEPQQPWLHRGLRISDIIVDLLRYKWHYDKPLPFRQDYRKVRLNALLEALRKPWGRCSVHSGEASFPTGIALCESCRFSLLSIAGNINTLALGFTVTPGFGKQEEAVEETEHSKDAAELESTRSKLADVELQLDQKSKELDTVKSELVTIKSKLTTVETDLFKTKKTADDLEKEKTTAKKKLKTEQSHHRKDLAEVKIAFDGMAEKVKVAIELANLSKESSGTTTSWKMAETLLEALASQVDFLLDAGIAMDKLSEDDERKKRQMLQEEAEIYRRQRVGALLQVGDTAAARRAEPLAKKLLDQRRKGLGKSAEETDNIFWAYCKILTKLNKYDEVELEYQQVWLNTLPVDTEFREKAGLHLAQLKESQKHRDEAALWYRKVAICRLERGEGPLAANAAMKMVMVQRSFHHSTESSALLNKIWIDYKEQKDGETPISFDILSCGQEVGAMLASVGKFQEANAELMTVWKALEKHGEAGLERRRKVALSLAAIAPERLSGDDADLRELAKWLQSNFTKSNEDKKASQVALTFAYCLGCLEIGRGDYTNAESTLKAAWTDAKAQVGKSDELTINIAVAYAQALELQIDKVADPKKPVSDPWLHPKKVLNEAWLAFKSVWNKTPKPARTAAPTSTQQALVLRVARPYAEFLLKDAEAEPKEKTPRAAYAKVLEILERAWDVGKLEQDASPPSSRGPGLLADLLWVGNTYGECLTYVGDAALAVQVLTVVDKHNGLNPDPEEVKLTAKLLKAAQDAKAEAGKAEAAKAEAAKAEVAEAEKEKPAEGQSKTKPDGDAGAPAGKDKAKGAKTSTTKPVTPTRPRPKARKTSGWTKVAWYIMT